MMKNDKTKKIGVAGTICVVLLWGLGLTAVHAQEAVSSSGGDAATGGGGTVAYTVGQVFYYTYTGSGSSEAQGVQQPNLDVSLPVTLVSFDAEVRKNEGVLVRWSTTAELHNDFFAIERSADGKGFEELTRVKGKGESTRTVNYQFVDFFPYPGKSYYRLKQTDYDGSFSYSSMKEVVVTYLPNSLSVYPNPTTDYLNIGTSGLKKENFTVRVTDMNGKLLEAKKLSGSQSSVDMRYFQPAIYMITVFHNNSTVRTFKVIKN